MQGRVFASCGASGLVLDQQLGSALQLPAGLAVEAHFLDDVAEHGAPVHLAVVGGLEQERAGLVLGETLPALGVTVLLGAEDHLGLHGAAVDRPDVRLAADRVDVAGQHLPGGGRRTRGARVGLFGQLRRGLRHAGTAASVVETISAENSERTPRPWRGAGAGSRAGGTIHDREGLPPGLCTRGRVAHRLPGG